MINVQFLAICIANFFFFSSIFFSTTLLPILLSNNGFQETMIGFIFGISAIAALGGRFLSGWSVDRWGTKFFLVLGATIWTIVSPLVALTTNFWLLIIFRLFQGLGLAIFMNASLGFIMYTTAEVYRGRATSWFGIANNLAAAIGPLLAAYALLNYDMVIAFYIGGALAFITLIICVFLPQVKQTSISGEKKRPKLYIRSAILPGIIGSSLSIATGAFMIFAPLKGQEMGYEQVGIFITVYAISMIMVRVIAGWLSDIKGRHWTIIPGYVAMITGFLIMIWIKDPFWILVGPALLGIGVGASLPGLIAWSVDRANQDEKANAGSTFYIFYEIGMFLGSVIIGYQLQKSNWLSLSSIGFILAIALVSYSIAYNKDPASKAHKSRE